MNTAYAVLLLLLVLYVPLYFWVYRNRDKAERYRLGINGPFLMIKTHLGTKTMERLGRYKRFWRVFGFLSKLTSAVLLFLMMYVLITAFIALPSVISRPAIGIEYALAIPGFNPILPLSYGIAALLFAMIVHEMGHGIQSRANNVDVKSTGLIYGVVPLGAYVEPDEDQINASSRRARMDIYSAGITVNTVFAVAALLILSLSCSAIESPYVGEAGIYSIDEDSPALRSGIPAASIITGAMEENTGTVIPVTAGISGSSYSLETENGFDSLKRYQFRYVYKGETSVTGHPVQMGAYIKNVVKDSPASAAGLEPGTFVYSIEIGGAETKITSVKSFYDFMQSAAPGSSAVIRTVAPGSATADAHDMTVLDDSGGTAFLGITVTSGGFTVITPDALMSRASSPFYGADGSPMSYVTSLFSYLSGPINGMTPVSDEVKWWYDVPMGDIAWIVLTMLYWIFWLDILLAISNALPSRPFDGGLLFAGWIDWVLEKTGMGDGEKRRETGEKISSAMSNVVLLIFLMVIITMII